MDGVHQISSRCLCDNIDIAWSRLDNISGDTGIEICTIDAIDRDDFIVFVKQRMCKETISGTLWICNPLHSDAPETKKMPVPNSGCGLLVMDSTRSGLPSAC